MGVVWGQVEVVLMLLGSDPLAIWRSCPCGSSCTGAPRPQHHDVRPNPPIVSTPLPYGLMALGMALLVCLAGRSAMRTSPLGGGEEVAAELRKVHGFPLFLFKVIHSFLHLHHPPTGRHKVMAGHGSFRDYSTTELRQWVESNPIEDGTTLASDLCTLRPAKLTG